MLLPGPEEDEEEAELVGEATAFGFGSAALQPVDSGELKCLLLQALLLTLPVMAGDPLPARDPSPVLAAELLRLAGKQQGGSATPAPPPQLKQLCISALLNLSPARQELQHPQQQQTQRLRTSKGVMPHVFIAIASSRLLYLLSGSGSSTTHHGEASAILRLVADYLEAAQSPSVVAPASRHFTPALQAVLGVVQSGGSNAAEWRAMHWQLFHAALRTLAPLYTMCSGGDAGRALLALLLGDRQTAAMVTGAAEYVLLHPPPERRFCYGGQLVPLQRDMLQCLAALIGMIGRLPALPSPSPTHAQDPPGDGASRAISLLRISSTASGPSATARSGGEEGSGDPGHDVLLGKTPESGARKVRAGGTQGMGSGILTV